MPNNGSHHTKGTYTSNSRKTEKGRLFDGPDPSDYRTRNDSTVPIVTEEGTSRTLQLSDAGTVVEFTNSGSSTAVLPHSDSVDFPIGSLINIYAAGAGGVTISPESGVVVQNLMSIGQHNEAVLRKRGENSWVQSGIGDSPEAHSHTEGDVTNLGSYPDATGLAAGKIAESDGADGWVFIDTPTGGGGAGTDDQTASEVPFSPFGGITSDNVQNAIQELDTEKADSSHQHTASEVSDFNTAVRTNRLDQMASPTADIDMGGNKIVNTVTPTATGHAANKGYVDTEISGHSHTESDISDLGTYPDASGAAATKIPQTDGAGGWTFIDTPSGGGGGDHVDTDHYDAFITVVEHGSDGNVARPSGAVAVHWYGTVDPVNMNETTDLFIDLDAPGAVAPDATGLAAGKIAESDGADGWTYIDTPAGGGGGAVAVEDEGTQILAAAARLNFVGSGVTVTDAGSNEATVTIPGGGGGGGTVSGARVTRATNQLTTSGATAFISWDSAEFDDDNWWSIANPTELVVPAGITRVTFGGYCQWEGSDAAGTRKMVALMAEKNGNTMAEVSTTSETSGASANQFIYQNVSTYFNVVAGDVLQLRVFQTWSTTKNLTGGLMAAWVRGE